MPRHLWILPPELRGCVWTGSIWLVYGESADTRVALPVYRGQGGGVPVPAAADSPTPPCPLPPPLNATQQILILGFIPTWPPSLSTSPLIRFISPPPLTLLTATSAAAPPPLTKAGVLQRVAAFLAAYEHAMPAPAPTMVGSDALSLPGGDFPYAVSSATLSAVAAVFVKNAANVGVADRTRHPFGVFAGAPGTGKTRGLLELLTSLRERCRLDAVKGVAERGALAALQAGRYRHTDLVVWTYNNGNEPCDADGTVSHLPGSIPLLCVLHARVRRFLKACTL